MHKLFKSRVVAVTAGAATVISLGAGGAVAAGMITGDDIRNGSIHAVDLHRNSVGASELAGGSVRRGHITNGTVGIAEMSPWMSRAVRDSGLRSEVDTLRSLVTSNSDSILSDLESDGPYPDGTPENYLQNLGEEGSEGAQSGDLWVNNGGLQQSWVQCAEGKVALGGGFTLASDASIEDKLATRVLSSQPVQIVNGEFVYQPIEDDAAGSFVPNAWLVEGVYQGTNTNGVVVRPHVICAEVDAEGPEAPETDEPDTEEPDTEEPGTE